MSARLARFFPALAAFVLATLLLFVPPFIETLSHETEVSAAPVMQGEPTPEATPESIPTPESVAEVAVDLTADQPRIEAGEMVTYTVVITNTTDEAVGDLVLRSTLPPSTTFVADPNSAVTYNLLSNTITWDAGDVPANMILTVTYQIQADTTATDTLLLAEVEATSPDLTETLESWEVSVVGDIPPNEMWITPKGGAFSAEVQPVSIIVPNEGITEPLYFRVGDSSIITLPTFIWSAFDLTATNKSDDIVTTFPASLTISVRLDEFFSITEPLTETPSIYWFNEDTTEWQVVESRFDREANLLTAKVDHFSSFGFGPSSVGSYGMQNLPTVSGFVFDESSGNSSIQYPFVLPPTPGNLPFNLALNYSSEGVNSLYVGANDSYDIAPYFRQASAIGWGWNLSGLGQITVNHGDDYRVSLSYPGGHYDLENTGPATWQTEPQSFLTIVANNGDQRKAQRWYVYTQDGMRYTFGDEGGFGHNGGAGGQGVAYNLDLIDGDEENPECPPAVGDPELREAHLTEIKDALGNAIKIEYGREERTWWNACNEPASYIRAIRPLTATYWTAPTVTQTQSVATARIAFKYETRSDTGIFNQNTNDVQALWSSNRLDRVEISVRDASGAWTLARKYQLVPDTTYSSWHLLLTEVRDYGAKTSGIYLANSFVYTKTQTAINNTTVLRWADNGRGGRVNYSYRRMNNIDVRGCTSNSLGAEDLTQHRTDRYFVHLITTEDGIGNTTSLYLTPTLPFAHGEDYEGTACKKDFEFGGFGKVIKEVRQGTTVFQKNESYYHTNVGDEVSAHAGLMKDQWVYSGTTAMEWAHITYTIDSAYSADWVKKTAESHTVFGSGGNLIRTTDYLYSMTYPYYQQFGQPTRIREFANGVLVRRQELEYRFDNSTSNPLVVVKLSNQRLYDVNNTCVGETRYFYDYGTTYPTTPTQGLLTQIEVAQDSCGGSWRRSNQWYDGWGNLIQTSDPNGNITRTKYDTALASWPKLYVYPIRVTGTVTTGLNIVTTYLWTPTIGQVTRVTDVNNTISTAYTYDAWGRVKTVSKPVGSPMESLQRYNYDDAVIPHRIGVETRTNMGVGTAVTWNYQHHYYDGLGREIETKASHVTPTGTPTHTVTYTKYHALGGVAEIYAPITYTPTATYLLPSVWGANPARTITSYDRIGRVTKVRSSDSTETFYGYQTVNNGGIFFQQEILQYQVSGSPVATRYRYDALGRLRQVVERNNTQDYATTDYTYNHADQLRTVEDELGNTTVITYNLGGLKTAMDDPDMGRWDYRYNANGVLKAQVDANGNGICFRYDGLGRMIDKYVYRNTTIATIGGTNCPTTNLDDHIDYGYDQTATNAYNIGYRTSMSDSTGTTRWAYNQYGQVMSDTKSISYGTNTYTFRMQYGYDLVGRLRKVTYPADSAGHIETVTYNYDSSHQALLVGMSGVSNGVTTTYASNIAYNQYGQVVAQTIGANVNQTFGYWPITTYRGAGRLQWVKAERGTPYQELQHLRYENPANGNDPGYDALGNVKYIVNRTLPYTNGQGQTAYHTHYLQYDLLNRMTDADVSGASGSGIYSEDFSYNKIGNIENRDPAGGDVSLYFYAGNAPHAVTQVYHSSTGGSYNNYYSYDNVGNMTRRQRKEGSIMVSDTFTYDGENRLEYVTLGDSLNVDATYKYDGDGNRVSAYTAGEGTLHPNPFVEYRLNGGTPTLVKYYFVGSQRVAMREGSSLYYFLQDHLGSTSLTLDSSGAKVAETRYDVWGKPFWQWQTTPTNRLYTGQLWDGKVEDSGTGLYFYNARYYDPALGRFTQTDTIVPDPSNPQTLNRFSYVLNNPLIYTDPTGHCAENRQDDPECWAAKDAIEAAYPNITVDWQYWTTQELEQLLQALNSYLLIDEILDAKITFFRDRFYKSSADGTAGAEIDIAPGIYQIWIFDWAYFLTPDGNGISQTASWDNFSGTIYHELTHVAIDENPFILESFYLRNSFSNLETWLPLGFGNAYNRNACGNKCAEEIIAMAVSTYMLSPQSFEHRSLLVNYTDWHKDWIELFMRGRPLPIHVKTSIGAAP